MSGMSVNAIQNPTGFTAAGAGLKDSLKPTNIVSLVPEDEFVKRAAKKAANETRDFYKSVLQCMKEAGGSKELLKEYAKICSRNIQDAKKAAVEEAKKPLLNLLENYK